MMEENQQIIRKGRGHRQSDQQPRDERGEYYETLEERGKGPSKCKLLLIINNQYLILSVISC